mmetsp:Transcript_5158/g.10493  ORF Transcript_5158/g.10493 Transcript_5158/m.10493 type:complete len:370 (+) Transcript_5158:1867-2976(+)
MATDTPRRSAAASLLRGYKAGVRFRRYFDWLVHNELESDTHLVATEIQREFAEGVRSVVEWVESFASSPEPHRRYTHRWLSLYLAEIDEAVGARRCSHHDECLVLLAASLCDSTHASLSRAEVELESLNNNDDSDGDLVDRHELIPTWLETPRGDLYVRQSVSQLSGLGFTTWEGGRVLVEVLLGLTDHVVRNTVLDRKHVMELGAGTGFVISAILQDTSLRVQQGWVTDVSTDIIANCRHNLNGFPAERVRVGVVDVMESNGIGIQLDRLGWVEVPDVVIASDMAYDYDLCRSVVRGVEELVHRGTRIAIVASCVRSEGVSGGLRTAVGESRLRWTTVTSHRGREEKFLDYVRAGVPMPEVEIWCAKQ